jgi:hypothetical protein
LLAIGGGFSVELWFTINKQEAGQELLSTMGNTHKGIRVILSDNKGIGIQINDGELRENNLKGQTFFSDANTLEQGNPHHVVFTIDGAAKIASIIVDGILSDGSIDEQPYGWGRLHPHLKDLNNVSRCTLNPSFDGKIRHMRVYERYLTTSEAIANYLAGPDE